MTHTRTYPAKVTRPKASMAYRRKRLFNRLDAALNSKAMWVVGPAGSGKTTLASSYVEAKKLPCLWYQADEGDSDPTSFFLHLALAAKRFPAKRNTPLPALTPEYLRDVKTFARNFFRDFFSRLPKKTVVVIDNYQDAQVAPGFNELAASCVAEAPAHCKVVILSRTSPPKAFSRMVTYSEMSVLGFEDLRLGDDEAKGIALALGHKFSASGLSDINASSGGWMAGFILMCGAAQRHPAEISGPRKSSRESIFEYFMSEVFEKTDPVERDFLVKTSVLPAMTAETAIKLSGNKDADLILDDLSRRQFFMARRGGIETTYQYHPLFREFLASRLKSSLTEADAKLVCKEAGRILSDRGEIEDASRLFIEAQDWKGAAEVITNNGKRLVSEGRYKTLEGWLSAMPEAELSSRPRLKYYQGLCRLPFDMTAARKVFIEAFEALDSVGDPDGAFLSWAGIVNTFCLSLVGLHELDGWIERFERMRERYGDFQSKDAEERASSAFFAALLYRQPWRKDIEEWAEKAAAIIRSSNDTALRLSTAGNVILYYLWTGRTSKAGLIVEALGHTHKGSAIERIVYLRASALYCVYSGECEKGIDAADEGLKLSRDSGIAVYDFMLLGAGVYSLISLGMSEKAGQYLGRMAVMATSQGSVPGYASAVYHHVASLLHSNLGSAPSAIGHARAAVKLASEGGAPFHECVISAAAATVLAVAGEYAEAKRLLASNNPMCVAVNASTFFQVNQLTEALLALREEKADEFRKNISLAFAGARAQGLWVFGALNHEKLAHACAAALDEGIEPEYARECIRRHDLYKYPPGVEFAEWPWPLKVYTLGGFSMLVNGRPVESGKKASLKPLELISCLIALGGQDVHERVISDALWPDADGDLSHRSFSVTLHRTRNLLGDKKALVFKNRRLSLDPMAVWTDVSCFDRLIEMSSDAGHERKTALLKKALSVYKGNFLKDEEHPWALACRERLRSKYVNAATALADILEKGGETEKAIKLYNECLKTDDLDERIYQRLMKSLAIAGKKPEITRTYERLKAVLASRLGVEPSEETEVIRRAILAGK